MTNTVNLSKSHDNAGNIARGVAAYLVVLGHCFRYTASALGMENDGAELLVVRMIYSFHMPLFMLLCGFYSYGSLRRKGIWTFMGSRAKKLLFPLLFWAIVQTGYGLLKGEANQFALFFARFFGGYWFLWAVLILSALCGCIEQIRSKRTKAILYCCLGLLCIITPDGWTNSSNIKFMYPYFLIGYKVNEYHNEIRQILVELKKIIKEKYMLLFLNIVALGMCCTYPENWLIDVAGFSAYGKGLPQLLVIVGRFLFGALECLAIIVDIRILYTSFQTRNAEMSTCLFNRMLQWGGEQFDGDISGALLSD